MHYSCNKNGLPVHGIDQAIRKPLKEIAPKPAFQNSPGTRVSLNLVEGQINGIKEFLS